MTDFTQTVSVSQPSNTALMISEAILVPLRLQQNSSVSSGSAVTTTVPVSQSSSVSLLWSLVVPAIQASLVTMSGAVTTGVTIAQGSLVSIGSAITANIVATQASLADVFTYIAITITQAMNVNVLASSVGTYVRAIASSIVSLSNRVHVFQGTASVAFSSYTANFNATNNPGGVAPSPVAPLFPFVQRGDIATWQAIFTDLFGKPIIPNSATVTLVIYGRVVAIIPMVRSGSSWTATWDTSLAQLGAPPVQWTVRSTGPGLADSGTFRLF